MFMGKQKVIRRQKKECNLSNWVYTNYPEELVLVKKVEKELFE